MGKSRQLSIVQLFYDVKFHLTNQPTNDFLFLLISRCYLLICPLSNIFYVAIGRVYITFLLKCQIASSDGLRFVRVAQNLLGRIK